jgi:4'-phosphopantetheinyl transferase
MSSDDQVEVYTVDLRICAQKAAACKPLMNAAERARAGRFVHEKDRLGFVAAHAGLRLVLGEKLGLRPQDVGIRAPLHRKPELVDHRHLHFNLTHAGDIALIAVTSRAPLGVDVEPLRAMSDMAPVAETVFCDAEIAAWRAVPDALRERAFFCGWTRKEALIKATGEGFRADLKALCVVLDPAARPAVLASPPSDEPPWHLAHLEPRSGYVGAVAMRSEAPFAVSMEAVTLPS